MEKYIYLLKMLQNQAGKYQSSVLNSLRITQICFPGFTVCPTPRDYLKTLLLETAKGEDYPCVVLSSFIPNFWHSRHLNTWAAA